MYCLNGHACASIFSTTGGVIFFLETFFTVDAAQQSGVQTFIKKEAGTEGSETSVPRFHFRFGVFPWFYPFGECLRISMLKLL